jgi:hypothetical protein
LESSSHQQHPPSTKTSSPHPENGQLKQPTLPLVVAEARFNSISSCLGVGGFELGVSCGAWRWVDRSSNNRLFRFSKPEWLNNSSVRNGGVYVAGALVSIASDPWLRGDVAGESWTPMTMSGWRNVVPGDLYGYHQALERAQWRRLRRRRPGKHRIRSTHLHAPHAPQARKKPAANYGTGFVSF